EPAVCLELGEDVASLRKLQIPSSKHQRSSKFQAPNVAATLVFDVWCFSGAWSLVLGAFHDPPSRWRNSPCPRINASPIKTASTPQAFIRARSSAVLIPLSLTSTISSGTCSLNFSVTPKSTSKVVRLRLLI